MQKHSNSVLWLILCLSRHISKVSIPSFDFDFAFFGQFLRSVQLSIFKLGNGYLKGNVHWKGFLKNNSPISNNIDSDMRKKSYQGII